MEPLLRILYVDDSPLDRELVRDALEEEHGAFQVTEAASREEFEARLEDGDYDLVLSDFNILGFEGLQVLDLVRTRCPGLPVVIVTGTGSEAIAAEAIKSGAADYVIKSPQHIQRLPHTIDAVLEKNRLEKEHRQWESKLRMSEERFRAIFENAPQGLVLADGQGRFLAVNRSWQEMFGYSSQEAQRLTYRDVTPDEEIEESKAKFEDLMSERTLSYRMEKRFVRKNGAIFWGDLSVRLLDDPSTDEKRALGLVVDITESKKAEKGRSESEARFKEIYDRAPVMMHSVDRDAIIRNVNEKWLTTMGYTREEVLGLKITSFMTPESGEKFNPTIQKFWQDREIHDVHYRYVKKHGEIIDVMLDAIVLDHPTWGEISISTARNVTELLRAESALEQSRKSFTNVVESSADGIMVLDLDGIVLYANRAAATICDQDREQLPGIHMGIPQSTRQAFETRMMRPSGEGRIVDVRASHTNWEGSPAYLLTMRDVTDLREREAQHQRLGTAIDQAAESVMITDERAIILYVNPAFERITGYSKDEAIGRNPRILQSGEHDAAFYKEMWRTLSRGRVWQGHLINRRKDGSRYEEYATISPIRNESGSVTSYVAVKRDVTDEVSLRKQLQKAQKLESIATMAGGIAHDFNNLLTIASGYTELLLMDRRETSPGYHELQAIAHSLDRGADLVKRILTFSRQVETFPDTLNLNDEVQNVVKLLTRTIPKMVEIDALLAQDLKTVTADPGQIEQALLNLAMNSQHAMPDGGRLTIETRNVTLDETYCETHVEAKPGDYVLLMVSDTGHGMEKEVLDRVFEPFFSTKKAGEGTGLGLSMVFGVVKGHGGHVTCYSEPGAGTTFKIYLPTGERTEEETEAERSGLRASFGSETILLVDDEELIRDLGTKILKQVGYTVLTADNGREAVEIYKRRRDEVALVVLDMIMPEMGGKECLDRLIAIDPEVKVVVASGFSMDGPVKESVHVKSKGFVSKPFDVKQLRLTVRAVLDAH